MTYGTKIQDGQIVVPSRLKRLAGLVEGDQLDITFESGKLIVVSKVRSGRANSVSRSRNGKKQAREELMAKLRDGAPGWLKETWAESERKGLDKMTMREINAEIASVRREQAARQRRVSKQPVK